MRISDWSSDVCSSDLNHSRVDELFAGELRTIAAATSADGMAPEFPTLLARLGQIPNVAHYAVRGSVDYVAPVGDEDFRSEEHTSELQSLMRISYAVFCLKKKKKARREMYETNKR